MARALVPLAEGFEEVEAVTVVDVLRRGGVEVVLASIGEGLGTRGAHGITVTADAMFADVADEDYDAIVLPGGGEGTERVAARPDPGRAEELVGAETDRGRRRRRRWMRWYHGPWCVQPPPGRGYHGRAKLPSS